MVFSNVFYIGMRDPALSQRQIPRCLDSPDGKKITFELLSSPL
jgi:hypothetical protein